MDRRSLAAGLLAVYVALAGCTGPAAETPDGEAATWSFTDTQGVEHASAGAQGSPTVLFFMATWCSDCRTKAGWLDDVVAEYADRNLTVYSLSTSPSTDTDAKLEQWKQDFNQSWPHGVDRDGRMQTTFGVTSQSTLVVLDAQGVVVGTLRYGSNDADGLRNVLDEAFGA